jgi:hypothetical protein
MPEPRSDRIYTDEEIARILKRAADLQGRESRRPVLGLTLTELQQLARESDIDPALITAAALELAGTPDREEAGFWGGPLTLTIRRRVEGNVSEDTFNRMVSEARRRFKKSGTTSLVGSTREWSTENERDASASFSLRERDGHTEIEIFWTESDILPIPFVTTPLVFLMLSIPLLSEGIGLGGAPFAVGLAMMATILFFASRGVFRTLTSGHRRGVRQFADQLVDIAHQERGRAHSAARQSATAVDAPAPRIALDEPPDAESEDRARTDRPRTRTP